MEPPETKDEIAQRLARIIKVVFSDVDGVFTNNQVLEGAPYKAKWRNYFDGQGVSLLRAIGIRVVLITNEKDESAKHIEEVVYTWNNLKSSKRSDGSGEWDHVRLFTGYGGEKKVCAAAEFLAQTGFDWSECAFMGDDLVDIPLMRLVALRAVPVSGEDVVRDIAHFISQRPGGSGAFRDFANFILKVRNIDPTTLSSQ